MALNVHAACSSHIYTANCRPTPHLRVALFSFSGIVLLFCIEIRRTWPFMLLYMLPHVHTGVACCHHEPFRPEGLARCACARAQNTVVLSVRCWGRRATATALKLAAAGATVAVAWLVGSRMWRHGRSEAGAR